MQLPPPEPPLLAPPPLPPLEPPLPSWLQPLQEALVPEEPPQPAASRVRPKIVYAKTFMPGSIARGVPAAMSRGGATFRRGRGAAVSGAGPSGQATVYSRT